MRYRIFIILAVVVAAAAFSFFFTGSPAHNYSGVDEVVVEKFARDAGREPAEPLINTDRGDLLLFFFTLAGAIGGFASGYLYRDLFGSKDGKPVV